MISTTTEQNYLLSDSVRKGKLLFFIANFYLWQILFPLLIIAILPKNSISTFLGNQPSLSNVISVASSAPWTFDYITCSLLAVSYPFLVSQNMFFDERTHKALLFKHKNACQMLLISILTLANCTAMFLIQNPSKTLQFMSIYQFSSCIILLNIGFYNLRPGHVFYLDNPEESLLQEISCNTAMMGISATPHVPQLENYDERENQNAHFWQSYAYRYCKLIPWFIGIGLILTTEYCRNALVGPINIDLVEKVYEVPAGFAFAWMMYLISCLLTDLPDVLAAWNSHKIPQAS